MDVGELAPECRLIIDFVLGPRKQYVADKLVEITDKCLSDLKPLFVTDGLKFYAEALLQKYGRLVKFPKTGKCQWRLRIFQFRRFKTFQFTILEKSSRIVDNAENGGMAIDTRFVFTRL
ncbi:hypothetical protein DU63_11430 [Methanosarcina mazei]|uniref:Uncharacterized protein n=1 Tax=Methanosarcina mazei TaxID=2209 RepID=A0A0F8JIA9_METMZ|nr:hypothetical protein DU63_11430 [Methanosarcina mazei]